LRSAGRCAWASPRLAASRATALGDLEDPASHTARALTDPSPDPPQGSSEHSDPVSQERGVRGIVNVGFDDGGIDAQAPAPHDAALAPQGHQPGHHILEHRLVQKAGQPDQRLRVWNALAVDPAERAVHQATPHLPLALIDVLVETWIGFGSRPVLTPERIRVLGVNTPERGQPGFQEASDYSEAWLMKGDVTLSGCARDSFGRVLATVTRGPESLADLLIANLLGVPFKK